LVFIRISDVSHPDLKLGKNGPILTVFLRKKDLDNGQERVAKAYHKMFQSLNNFFKSNRTKWQNQKLRELAQNHAIEKNRTHFSIALQVCREMANDLK